MINETKDNSYEYQCCFTGYRPSKFPFELSEYNENYIDFENSLVGGILNLIEQGCTIFYILLIAGEPPSLY